MTGLGSSNPARSQQPGRFLRHSPEPRRSQSNQRSVTRSRYATARCAVRKLCNRQISAAAHWTRYHRPGTPSRDDVRPDASLSSLYDKVPDLTISCLANARRNLTKTRVLSAEFKGFYPSAMSMHGKLLSQYRHRTATIINPQSSLRLAHSALTLRSHWTNAPAVRAAHSWHVILD
jgi:hypothetical protein